MRFTIAFVFLIQLSGSAFCFQKASPQNFFDLGSPAFENKKWKEAQDYHRGTTHHRMGKLKDPRPDLFKAKELGMEAAEIA
jgi:hypothetical protein